MKDFQYSFARSVYLVDGPFKSPLFKAFLQEDKKDSEEKITIIGRMQNESYLYLGPARHDLTCLNSTARLIDSAQNAYRIVESKKVYKGDEVFYIRAILERERK